MYYFKITYTNELSKYAKTPEAGIRTDYKMCRTATKYTEAMLQFVHKELPPDIRYKLLTSKQLRGEALRKFLWEEPRHVYHIESGDHIKLMCKELRKLGFTIEEQGVETLVAIHNKKHVKITFNDHYIREVLWELTPEHPHYKIAKQYAGKTNGILGLWMSRSSTTESSLDFDTLTTIHARIVDMLERLQE